MARDRIGLCVRCGRANNDPSKYDPDVCLSCALTESEHWAAVVANEVLDDQLTDPHKEGQYVQA